MEVDNLAFLPTADLLTFGNSLVNLLEIIQGLSSLSCCFAPFCFFLPLSCKGEICSGSSAEAYKQVNQIKQMKDTGRSFAFWIKQAQ